MNRTCYAALSIVFTAFSLSASAIEPQVFAKGEQDTTTLKASNTFSLTSKEDTSGGKFDPDLPVAAPGNYLIHKKTVEDLSTGLEWQRGQDLHAGLSWMDAQAYCRDLSWGGATGWRLPDAFELLSLVKYDQSPPGQTAIDVQAFPETKSGTSPEMLNTTRDYWTSTTHWSSFWGYDEPYAVVVNFFGGEMYTRKTDEQYAGTFARCVRGGKGLGPAFRNNGDGTVTDLSRSLIWQQDADDNPANAGPYCEGLTLGGLSNWRLPTVQELASLLDFRNHSKTAYTAMFPSSFYDWDIFWITSQANVKHTSQVWSVIFTPGGYGYQKYSIVPVHPAGGNKWGRCVHSAE